MSRRRLVLNDMTFFACVAEGGFMAFWGNLGNSRVLSTGYVHVSCFEGNGSAVIAPGFV